MALQTTQGGAFTLTACRLSVGRKVLVALSGMFLMVFLVVHLGINLTLLCGARTYNALAHWMGTTPVIVVLRPVLFLGVVVHVILSVGLWLGNLRSRPERYSVVDPAGGSTWSSRNMLVLGVLVFLFLVLHIASFSIPLTLGSPDRVVVEGVVMKDAYALVSASLGQWWYGLLYVLAAVFLGLHLSHGFQSALQTVGLSDASWRGRWTVLGNVYAVLVAAGFAILPVYFVVQSLVGGAR